MKNIIYCLFAAVFIWGIPKISSSQDWADLNHYKSENDTLGLPQSGENRVVFMGNSITESWKSMRPDFFKGNSYLCRGISGQTTPQMLLRFRADVINLKPAVVVILAGINDIAGNTGPSTPEMILDNIISMTQLAQVNGIKVILSSVLPAIDFPWNPGVEPAEKIVIVNGLIKRYAENNQIIYLDYYASMVNEKLGLQEKYTYDGVHPNQEGYEIMEPLVVKAIQKALNN